MSGVEEMKTIEVSDETFAAIEEAKRLRAMRNDISEARREEFNRDSYSAILAALLGIVTDVGLADGRK
jgi:hypothetical protein